MALLDICATAGCSKVVMEFARGNSGVLVDLCPANASKVVEEVPKSEANFSYG